MLKRFGPGGTTLLLLITIVSTAIVVILFSRQLTAVSEKPAIEEPDGEIAVVEAFAVQIRPGVEGIALVDKKHHTICLYQYQAHRPAHEGLVLLSARSFRYDVQLEDYNTAEPRPAEVKQLLQAPPQKDTVPKAR
ncbi:MAG: hypothetical protein KAT56_04560 [Sedimentisphaerales bacterium]|nr:hypothetical protein [Sedimentisphaerales bacterium]